MQEDYIPHYEIYHNRRWTLLEAERMPDRSIVLLLVYSQREMQHVGLAHIKKKFERFHKVQQLIGDKVLHASITSYNKNIALVFDFPQKNRIADSFVPLSQCTPISALSDFLDIALNLLQYIFVIHKNNCLHNCVNINAFVTHVGAQTNVQLLDMGDMMDVNSISSQGHTSLLHKGGSEQAHSAGAGSVDKDRDDTSSEDNTTVNRMNKEYLEELVDYRYASPEHTGRIESAIDRRSDIYSLGVLLYELVIGKVPFDSNDVLEVLHSHMTQNPPDFPSYLWANRSDVKAKVHAIILKMMNKAPQERYPHAICYL